MSVVGGGQTTIQMQSPLLDADPSSDTDPPRRRPPLKADPPETTPSEADPLPPNEQNGSENITFPSGR